MLSEEQAGLIQLLLRFEHPVVDHFERATCALSWSQILKDEILPPSQSIIVVALSVGRYYRCRG